MIKPLVMRMNIIHIKWLVAFLAITNVSFSQQFPVEGYTTEKFVRKPGVIVVADSTITVMYQVNDSLARQFTIRIKRTFHNDLFQFGGINGYLCDSGMVVISHRIIYVTRKNETIQFLKSKYWNPDQWRKKLSVIPDREYYILLTQVKKQKPR